MRKILLLLLLLPVFLGCDSKAGSMVSGDWKGTVLMVNVEYTFKANGRFTAKTLSSNDIMIGGGEGTFTLDDDILTLDYDKTYYFDTDTNQGYWIEEPMTFIFNYTLEEDNLVLFSPDISIDIVLNRV